MYETRDHTYLIPCEVKFCCSSKCTHELAFTLEPISLSLKICVKLLHHDLILEKSQFAKLEVIGDGHSQ